MLHDTINYVYGSYAGGCSPLPAIPYGALIVDTLMHYQDTTWRVLSFTISNLTSDYSQLWIRAQFSQGDPLVTTGLCIDSMCVHPISTPSPPPVAACYSFDNYIVPLDSQQQAFNYYGNGHPGFLQDWHVASGTPSIQPSQGKVLPYGSSKQLALMGVCDAGSDMSEGLELAYNFVHGNSYKVSLAVINAPITEPYNNPIDVQFILLHDTINYVYGSYAGGCSPVPGIPAGALIVDTMMNYHDTVWKVISFIITDLTTDYTQLWIRAQFSQGAPLVTTGLCIDSMCVQPVTPPPPPTAACYSFDNYIVPLDSQQQAFNYYGNGHAGFLQDWHVASGTPSIQPSQGKILPYGNCKQLALMGVCDAGSDMSEGLELAYNFVHGNSYKVSLAVINAPITEPYNNPIDVQFILLHDTINYVYGSYAGGCSPIPAIPVGALIVDTMMHYQDTTWKVISFTINNLTSDYSQLWIRAQFSQGAPLVTTGLCIDSMCVQPTANVVTTSNVWPGDANNDGIANYDDLLTIGMAYGDTGKTRPNASLVWEGQAAYDWSYTLPGGLNAKYADCNGDGIVNANDTLAILLNYGSTHNKAGQRGYPGDPQLYIQFPASDTIYTGQTVNLPIYLGKNSNPVGLIYGIAFSIIYDNILVDSNSMQLSATSSWVGTSGANLLTLHKDIHSEGETDMAFTRINHIDTSGSGYLCTVSYTIKKDIPGLNGSLKSLPFSIANVTAITSNATPVPLNYGTVDTVQVTGISNVSLSNSLRVYPNPSSQYIIADPGRVIVDQYIISDILGRQLRTIDDRTTGPVTIDVSELTGGIYFLRAKSGNDLVTVKFSVMR